MESYDEFIQKQLCQLRQSNDNQASYSPHSSRGSSVISFHGSTILPPLMNRERTEEMQRHRHAAATLTKRRKPPSDPRVSYIQTILDNVQLRQVPTLQEFFQDEPGVAALLTKDSQSSSFIAGSPKDEWVESTETHWDPPPLFISPSTEPVHAGQVEDHCHPLTSTVCDPLAAGHLKAFQEEDTLEDRGEEPVLSEAVMVLGEQTEGAKELDTSGGFNAQATPHSARDPHADVSHQSLSSGYITHEMAETSSLFGKAEGAESFGFGTGTNPASLGGFFLCNTAQSTSKGPDIISHAPMDGEALEEEEEEEEVEHVVAAPSQVDDASSARTEEPADPEGPYRMSLQNLLKKSQEHRRRQRLLRSQPKAARGPEGAAPAEEHSLSDKENEEVLQGGAAMAELRRTRERRREQGKVQFSHPETVQSDGPAQTRAEEEGTEGVEAGEKVRDVGETNASKNAISGEKSPDTTTDTLPGIVSLTGKASPDSSDRPTLIGDLHRPTSAVASLAVKSFYLAKGKKSPSRLPRPCFGVGKKFKSVPTPQFCLSPVRCKKAGGGSGAPTRKPLVKTPLCVDNEEGSGLSNHGNLSVAKMSPVVGGGVGPLVRSSYQTEQIAQLELNLSSLKALISDLESTLTETLPDQLDDHRAETSAVEHNSPQDRQTSPAGSGGTGGSVCEVSANIPCVATPNEKGQLEFTARDCGTGQDGHKQPPRCVTSLAQKMRVPDAFRNVTEEALQSQKGAVLTDYSNHSEEKRNEEEEEKKKKESEEVEGSLHASSLNQSYDVDTPSGLWAKGGSGWGAPPWGKQLTPETGGPEGASRAKRRLLMHTGDGKAQAGRGRGGGETSSSSPKAAWATQQLKEAHAEQVRALMEEQRRQQGELLQSLAVRYRFLQSVSFPCPSSSSRVGDALTSLPPVLPSSLAPDSSAPGLADLSALSDILNVSQPPPLSLPVSCRPLVAAVVKGFLARRLLRTERVAQLIRTIKDTRQFLSAFQPQTPGRGEFSSRQDVVLLERVTLQLRSARYEVHDIFFILSASDRMQIISWDRELARERELKRQESRDTQPKGKGSLSAATKRALERKRSAMLQKRTGGGEEGWTFRPNPRRVPKRTTPSRRPR